MQQVNLADQPAGMQSAILSFLELAARRDDGAPTMKVRLTAGLGRDLERTITVRAEVDGGYTDDDLLVVLGVGRRFGARASVQNSAIELIFDGSVEPEGEQTRAVRVEYAGQSVIVNVRYDDGGVKSVGNLAHEAAERMGAEQGGATTLHGAAYPDGRRILDGALSATLLEPGGVYQLVVAPSWEC